MRSMKYYIIDSMSLIKDVSKPYSSRSEAYSDLLELQKLFGKLRFYITEL